MSVIQKPTRVCGGCTACCTTHAVAELKKGMNETCRFCSENSCQIYPTRPRNCQAFHCEWMKGWVEESYRPDRSGVVLDYFLTDHLLAPVLMIWEYREGATADSLVWEVANQSLESKINVMLWYKSGIICLYLPPDRKLSSQLKRVIHASREIQVKKFPALVGWGLE